MPRVLIHVGTATQDGQAHLQSFTQQPLGRIVVKYPLLGKGDQLQIEHAGKFSLQALQRFHAAQAHEGIDLDVRAHRRATMTDGTQHDATGPLVDILDAECSLELGYQHLRGRPSTAQARGAIGDVRFIRMDV
jgi:hypothetical protein